jgi:hypothetical protein
MPGDAQRSAGGGFCHPAAAAIGNCLAAMYDAYLQSPIPERLAVLVTRIDQGERPRPDDASHVSNPDLRET